MRTSGRKFMGIGLGVLLAVLFAIVAVAQGLGHPNPSGDEIAVVEEADDGGNAVLMRDEFDTSLEVAAAQQGLEDVPAEDDPTYVQLRDSALANALLEIWFRGEADDRGIEVTEEDIDEELELVIEQQFEGSQRQFDRFIEQSPYTEETAREQIELLVIQNAIQSQILPGQPDVSESEVESYYEANSEQFEQPETRDVRVIETENRADAEEARERLDEDDSRRTFRQVARDLSIDEATQDTGGLREGVVEGQTEAALDAQIFSVAEGELVGPFEGESSFYVLQVQNVNPGQTVPLEDARAQIEQAIAGQRQQEIAQRFQIEFIEKWRSRTYCAEGFRIDRCANADPPVDTCPEEIATEQGCPTPVPPINPIEPGTAAEFGQSTGRPQGPCAWLGPGEGELQGRSCETWPRKPAVEQETPEGLPPELEQLPESVPPEGGEAPPEEPAPEEQPAPGE